MGINKSSIGPSPIVYILLFFLALIPRFFLISKSFFEFHPTRQFHSANLAQSYSLRSQESADPAYRNVALTHLRFRGKKEPRIMEYLVFLTGQLTGFQSPWVARLFSIIFWFTGAVFLLLIAHQLFGRGGAFLSTAMYLLLPFGINISRAFMPESLMTMLTLVALYFLLRHFFSPQSGFFLLAALFSGLAVLVKFVVIFPLVGTFVLLGIQKRGLRKFILNFQTFLFFVALILLGVVYYVYLFFRPSSLMDTIHAVFIPKMLLTPLFWKGWLVQIGKVTGWIPFLLGAAVLFTLKDRRRKAFIGGILLGYLIFSFMAVYSTAAIDYYHIALYLFVVIALGQLGSLAAVSAKMWPSRSKWISIGCVFFVFFLYFFSFSTAHWALLKENFKKRLELPASFLCGNQTTYLEPSEVSRKVHKAEEIGRIVGNSTKTVFLADSYGFPLMFHGILFGKYWPDHKELDARRQQGEPPMDAAERYLKEYYQWQGDFFIIEDMALWEEQPDLQNFLQTHFPLYAESTEYLIFDLQKNIIRESGKGDF